MTLIYYYRHSAVEKLRQEKPVNQPVCPAQNMGKHLGLPEMNQVDFFSSLLMLKTVFPQSTLS